MIAAANDRWSSLLQERAAYIDNVKVVAVATQIQIVVRGLDDLSGIYDKAAGAPADGSAAAAAGQEQRDELIRHLEQKGRAFLRLARKTPDHTQADQLMSLSVIFGGEAERLLLAEAA